MSAPTNLYHWKNLKPIGWLRRLICIHEWERVTFEPHYNYWYCEHCVTTVTKEPKDA